MRHLSLQLFVVITLLSTALTGCMVGPNFHSPASPETNSYTEPPKPVKTVSAPIKGSSGRAQHFVAYADIPGQWWTLFHSPELNQLIHIGLANSPNLAAAEAALRQAQETLKAQIGESLYPAVNALLSAERQQTSSASLGTTGPPTIFSLFNASVSVSYTLDVFGGARREIEALAAQVDYQAFQLTAAYLTLTSNIAATAILAASIQAQIQATHELIRAQEGQLVIVQKQFRLGGVPGTNVLSQQTLVAQTRATLPPLLQSLAQARHSLAVLVGTLPSESQLPEIKLSKLVLPASLPISVPSLLARQRPDIRASEALLHAASAQIGVATANLYPEITLNGSYGWQGNNLNNLFSPNNLIWSYGGQLLQPLFAGGSLRAKRRAAIDAFEQTAAQYRQTVLQAFQNVADSLRALQNDALSLQAQSQAEIAARNTLMVTSQQFTLGGVSYLSLLNAQRQYQQIRISRIQAQASRFSDTVALFQALGGGWWNQ